MDFNSILYNINLTELETYGINLITPNIVAMCLQIDKHKLYEELNNSESIIHKTYFKGYLQTKIKHQSDTLNRINTIDENKFIAQKINDFEMTLIKLNIYEE